MAQRQINRRIQRQLNAEIYSAYAGLLIAKIQVTEISNRNRAIGVGETYQEELQNINRYIQLVTKALGEE